MLFNSYRFLLVFLPLVLAAFWLLRANTLARRVALLVACFIFYGAASLNYLALLLAAITYLAARYLIAGSQPRRRIGLVLGLSSLLVLIFFKHAGLLESSLNGLGTRVGLAAVVPGLDMALPLGISFYTFNLISYTLDVYRDRIPPAHAPLTFFSYVSFFPTITSGPLIQYGPYREQYDSAIGQERPQSDQIELGLFGLIMGLAKKLIVADYLAAAIDPLLADYGQLNFWSAWLAVLGYTYQLYFDFSGYTDMAIGIGHLFGFRLPQNFNAPYTAQNITEFWQRWHITLSTWFRAYLFFPLSRALLKRYPRLGPDRVRALSLVLTMTLIGWWHGASWVFLAWGAYHGVLLALHAQVRMYRWPLGPAWLGRAATFFAVVMGWVLFRSDSVAMARSIYAALFGFHGFDWSVLGVPPLHWETVVFVGILFVLTNLPRDTWTLRPRAGWAFTAGMALLLIISLLMLGDPKAFLYFQF
ncbi:MAG: MBOAT family protein [Chloroflexi bacterium]|nr:MBOAT family protein [Chloroflexota bacterium]